MKNIEVYRRWAYLGLILGLGLSLAANLASASLDGHDPSVVELWIAAAPPGVVFVMIEVLARTPWENMTRWHIVKALVAIVVAGGAAVVSYIHLYHLAMDGQPNHWDTRVVAALTPLMIDGMLAGCTAALMVNQKSPVVVALGASTVLVGELVLFGRPQPVDKPVEPKPRRFGRKTPVPRETEQEKPRKRYAPRQHPLWGQFEADLGQWSQERMRRELSAWSGAETSDEQARSMLRRWSSEWESVTA